MKILIVGNGGREHALLWKLHGDAPSAGFFITRGNGGTASLATHIPYDPGDIPGITSWAESEAVDLVVVGPEAPLADGMVDALEKRGIPAFGPTADAAAIEASKAFAKDVMESADVDTAAYRTFGALDPALEYIREQGAPIVVKASGLAAGKGAIVCDTEADAVQAVTAMLRENAFGAAGSEVVIEEFMTGEELSVFALTDGRRAIMMRPSQDHKRVGEGDTGPNTGGMGAYAPVSIVDDALLETVRDRVLIPTLRELERRGRTFRGLLYAGLMLTETGPRVVEFNCRFGDPETQVVLPLMDSPLLDIVRTIAEGGSIDGHDLRWKDAAAVATVLASGGYPRAYEKGKPISIPADLEADDDVLIFHAGTRIDGGRLVTSGGRVLAATGVGPTIRDAASASREAAARIEFEDRQYRSDIGWRELERA